MTKYTWFAVIVSLLIGAGGGILAVHYISQHNGKSIISPRLEHEDHEEHNHEAEDHDEHVAHDEHPGDSIHEGEHEYAAHEEDVIHLTQEMFAALNLETQPVREGILTTTIELPSEVQWNTDRLVHITPRTAGIVQRVNKTLGDKVQQGDLLCVLDSREIGNAKMEYLADLRRFEVAKADFQRAKKVYENTKKLLDILKSDPTPEAAIDKAHDLQVGQNKNRLLTAYTQMRVNQQNYERLRQLRQQKIASGADFLEAKGDYEISRADYSSTREEIIFNLKLDFLRARRDFEVAQTEQRNSERALHLLGMTNKEIKSLTEKANDKDQDITQISLYSPTTGVITDRHLTRGEMVTTDTALYTIADMSNVWVMGRVYESEVRFLKVGQKATVRLDAYPGQLFEGVVDYISSRLDPQTRTLQARVVLPNPNRRFRPGMFGVVTVFTQKEDEVTASKPASLLIPLSALQRVDVGHIVFRSIEPGVFEKVPVQVMSKSHEYAEVKGELHPGDTLVVGDTFLLKSEIGKEGMSGGHAGHGH